ncbi:MAG: 50S ribosomal protein L11 methyltransferase [Methanobacteriaceae archaeon]|jgi:predicted RNA methylase|uniref:50S ribosomal protein L11 methyltransferase n=1 Tax=unclassified Methanobrevibacter TaxID=2638681 RepID=UPI002A14F902|nr:50S ribosomal protein L11 methyltransferase [Methanobacteriaceae archaeon]MDD3408141.1 50S ribosomal protein L11 methyltransferase [Methanobacteriaceae archaeon]
MKLQTTHYHFNLLKDTERLSAFYEAIKNKGENPNINKKLALDLGCGSGILSIFASEYYEKIQAIDLDPRTIKFAEENTKNFNNIQIINADTTQHEFESTPDLIICEMLDTALIEEEEVLTFNQIHNKIKSYTEIIPYGIINKIEPVCMEDNIIMYEDLESQPKYNIIGESVIYDIIRFKDYINPAFNKTIPFYITKNSTFNGVKITTYTLLNQKLICGPTPMLNPELIIPLPKELDAHQGETININLSYTMGKGLESIKINLI